MLLNPLAVVQLAGLVLNKGDKLLAPYTKVTSPSQADGSKLLLSGPGTVVCSSPVTLWLPLRPTVDLQ